MLKDETVALIQKGLELIDYSKSMELATNYTRDHEEYNYGYLSRLIYRCVQEHGTPEQVKEIYGKKQIDNKLNDAVNRVVVLYYKGKTVKEAIEIVTSNLTNEEKLLLKVKLMELRECNEGNL